MLTILRPRSWPRSPRYKVNSEDLQLLKNISFLDYLTK